MPGVNPPRVPEGLRDLMKSLTKEVLREKPPNIYEFSAQYFESILEEKKDFEFKGFEPIASYESIFKNRGGRNQVPLSVVYAIIPEGLTELIKEFIKAVLRENPKNICEFAVEYFRKLQQHRNVDSCSVQYAAYESYFKSNERFSFTPYVKCTCGRTFGEGMTHGHSYERQVAVISANNTGTTIKAVPTQRNGRKQVISNENESLIQQKTIGRTSELKSIATADSLDYETEKYVNAIHVLQRFFRRCLTKKQNVQPIIAKGENVVAAVGVNDSPQKEHFVMSEETAAFVIQRTLRKLFNEKFQKQLTTVKASAAHKHENILENLELNDNISEAASYTSASTALMSAESAAEGSEIGGFINYEEGTLQSASIALKNEDLANEKINISKEEVNKVKGKHGMHVINSEEVSAVSTESNLHKKSFNTNIKDSSNKSTPEDESENNEIITNKINIEPSNNSKILSDLKEEHAETNPISKQSNDQRELEQISKTNLNNNDASMPSIESTIINDYNEEVITEEDIIPVRVASSGPMTNRNPSASNTDKSNVDAQGGDAQYIASSSGNHKCTSADGNEISSENSIADRADHGLTIKYTQSDEIDFISESDGKPNDIQNEVDLLTSNVFNENSINTKLQNNKASLTLETAGKTHDNVSEENLVNDQTDAVDTKPKKSTSNTRQCSHDAATGDIITTDERVDISEINITNNYNKSEYISDAIAHKSVSLDINEVHNSPEAAQQFNQTKSDKPDEERFDINHEIIKIETSGNITNTRSGSENPDDVLEKSEHKDSNNEKLTDINPDGNFYPDETLSSDQIISPNTTLKGSFSESNSLENARETDGNSYDLASEVKSSEDRNGSLENKFKENIAVVGPSTHEADSAKQEQNDDHSDISPSTEQRPLSEIIKLEGTPSHSTNENLNNLDPGISPLTDQISYSDENNLQTAPATDQIRPLNDKYEANISNINPTLADDTISKSIDNDSTVMWTTQHPISLDNDRVAEPTIEKEDPIARKSVENILNLSLLNEQTSLYQEADIKQPIGKPGSTKSSSINDISEVIPITDSLDYTSKKCLVNEDNSAQILAIGTRNKNISDLKSTSDEIDYIPESENRTNDKDMVMSTEQVGALDKNLGKSTVDEEQQSNLTGLNEIKQSSTEQVVFLKGPDSNANHNASDSIPSIEQQGKLDEAVRYVTANTDSAESAEIMLVDEANHHAGVMPKNFQNDSTDRKPDDYNSGDKNILNQEPPRHHTSEDAPSTNSLLDANSSSKQAESAEVDTNHQIIKREVSDNGVNENIPGTDEGGHVFGSGENILEAAPPTDNKTIGHTTDVVTLTNQTIKSNENISDIKLSDKTDLTKKTDNKTNSKTDETTVSKVDVEVASADLKQSSLSDENILDANSVLAFSSPISKSNSKADEHSPGITESMNDKRNEHFLEEGSLELCENTPRDNTSDAMPPVDLKQSSQFNENILNVNSILDYSSPISEINSKPDIHSPGISKSMDDGKTIEHVLEVGSLELAENTPRDNTSEEMPPVDLKQLSQSNNNILNVNSVVDPSIPIHEVKSRDDNVCEISKPIGGKTNDNVSEVSTLKLVENTPGDKTSEAIPPIDLKQPSQSDKNILNVNPVIDPSIPISDAKSRDDNVCEISKPIDDKANDNVSEVSTLELAENTPEDSQILDGKISNQEDLKADENQSDKIDTTGSKQDEKVELIRDGKSNTDINNDLKVTQVINKKESVLNEISNDSKDASFDARGSLPTQTGATAIAESNPNSISIKDVITDEATLLLNKTFTVTKSDTKSDPTKIAIEEGKSAELSNSKVLDSDVTAKDDNDNNLKIDIGNLSSDSIIGTQNLHGSSNEIERSQKIVSSSYHSTNNKKQNDLNKANNKHNKIPSEKLITNPPIAEIYLKSFKLPPDALPWYDNSTADLNATQTSKVTSTEADVPQVKSEATPCDERHQKSSEVSGDDTEFSTDSLNDNYTRDSLELTSSKETDIEEDSLEMYPSKTVGEKERMATYFYGVHTPIAEARKVYKAPTAFIIPFEDKASKKSKRTDLKEFVDDDVPNDEINYNNYSNLKKEDPDTSEESSMKKPELSLKMETNESMEEAPELDSETPTKLFAELNDFDYTIDDIDTNAEDLKYSVDTIYSAEEILRLNSDILENESRDLKDLYVNEPEPSSASMLQTIVELNESETPRRDEKWDSTIEPLDASESLSGSENESSWTCSKEIDEPILSDEYMNDNELFESQPISRLKINMADNTNGATHGGIYEMSPEKHAKTLFPEENILTLPETKSEDNLNEEENKIAKSYAEIKSEELLVEKLTDPNSEDHIYQIPQNYHPAVLIPSTEKPLAISLNDQVESNKPNQNLSHVIHQIKKRAIIDGEVNEISSDCSKIGEHILSALPPTDSKPLSDQRSSPDEDKSVANLLVADVKDIQLKDNLEHMTIVKIVSDFIDYEKHYIGEKPAIVKETKTKEELNGEKPIGKVSFQESDDLKHENHNDIVSNKVPSNNQILDITPSTDIMSDVKVSSSNQVESAGNSADEKVCDVKHQIIERAVNQSEANENSYDIKPGIDGVDHLSKTGEPTRDSVLPNDSKTHTSPDISTLSDQKNTPDTHGVEETIVIKDTILKSSNLKSEVYPDGGETIVTTTKSERTRSGKGTVFINDNLLESAKLKPEKLIGDETPIKKTSNFDQHHDEEATIIDKDTFWKSSEPKSEEYQVEGKTIIGNDNSLKCVNSKSEEKCGDEEHVNVKDKLAELKLKENLDGEVTVPVNDNFMKSPDTKNEEISFLKSKKHLVEEETIMVDNKSLKLPESKIEEIKVKNKSITDITVSDEGEPMVNLIVSDTEDTHSENNNKNNKAYDINIVKIVSDFIHYEKHYNEDGSVIVTENVFQSSKFLVKDNLMESTGSKHENPHAVLFHQEQPNHHSSDMRPSSGQPKTTDVNISSTNQVDSEVNVDEIVFNVNKDEYSSGIKTGTAEVTNNQSSDLTEEANETLKDKDNLLVLKPVESKSEEHMEEKETANTKGIPLQSRENTNENETVIIVDNIVKFADSKSEQHPGGEKAVIVKNQFSQSKNEDENFTVIKHPLKSPKRAKEIQDEDKIKTMHDEEISKESHNTTSAVPEDKSKENLSASKSQDVQCDDNDKSKLNRDEEDNSFRSTDECINEERPYSEQTVIVNFKFYPLNSPDLNSEQRLNSEEENQIFYKNLMEASDSKSEDNPDNEETVILKAKLVKSPEEFASETQTEKDFGAETLILTANPLKIPESKSDIENENLLKSIGLESDEHLKEDEITIPDTNFFVESSNLIYEKALTGKGNEILTGNLSNSPISKYKENLLEEVSNNDIVERAESIADSNLIAENDINIGVVLKNLKKNELMEESSMHDELNESILEINQHLNDAEKLIEETVNIDTSLGFIEETIADLKDAHIQLSEFERLISQAPTPPGHEPSEDENDEESERYLPVVVGESSTFYRNVLIMENAAIFIQKSYRGYLARKQIKIGYASRPKKAHNDEMQNGRNTNNTDTVKPDSRKRLKYQILGEPLATPSVETPITKEHIEDIAASIIQSAFKKYIKNKQNTTELQISEDKNGDNLDSSETKFKGELNKHGEQAFEVNILTSTAESAISKKRVEEMAALVIQRTFKKYIENKTKSTDLKMSADSSWDNSQSTVIFVEKDSNVNKIGEDAKSYASLDIISDINSESEYSITIQPEPSAPTVEELGSDHDNVDSKVNWFVGNEPIVSTKLSNEELQLDLVHLRNVPETDTKSSSTNIYNADDDIVPDITHSLFESDMLLHNASDAKNSNNSENINENKKIKDENNLNVRLVVDDGAFYNNATVTAEPEDKLENEEKCKDTKLKENKASKLSHVTNIVKIVSDFVTYEKRYTDTERNVAISNRATESEEVTGKDHTVIKVDNSESESSESIIIPSKTNTNGVSSSDMSKNVEPPLIISDNKNPVENVMLASSTNNNNDLFEINKLHSNDSSSFKESNNSVEIVSAVDKNNERIKDEEITRKNASQQEDQSVEKESSSSHVLTTAASESDATTDRRDVKNNEMKTLFEDGSIAREKEKTTEGLKFETKTDSNISTASLDDKMVENICENQKEDEPNTDSNESSTENKPSDIHSTSEIKGVNKESKLNCVISTVKIISDFIDYEKRYNDAERCQSIEPELLNLSIVPTSNTTPNTDLNAGDVSISVLKEIDNAHVNISDNNSVEHVAIDNTDTIEVDSIPNELNNSMQIVSAVANVNEEVDNVESEIKLQSSTTDIEKTVTKELFNTISTSNEDQDEDDNSNTKLLRENDNENKLEEKKTAEAEEEKHTKSLTNKTIQNSSIAFEDKLIEKLLVGEAKDLNEHKLGHIDNILKTVTDFIDFEKRHNDFDGNNRNKRSSSEENVENNEVENSSTIKEFIKAQKDYTESNIPYEKLEEVCIKKSVSLTYLADMENDAAPRQLAVDEVIVKSDSTLDSNEKGNDSSEVEAPFKDTLDSMTGKLREADEIIERMQHRRASETRVNSVEEKLIKEASFDEPVIRTMQEELQERGLSADTEDEEIIMNRLQREETRESSAQSDSVIFGEEENAGIDAQEEEEEDFEESAIVKASLKRLYTIAAGEDPKTLFKSVTIDDDIKYIEPSSEIETSATSGSSFCLDDDTSENIRQKMMAYSLSEADSDYFDASKNKTTSSAGISIDKPKLNPDDFNISTALVDAADTSTETESTIVSAATKIQAGARGFLTRKRLRRASAGTKSSIPDESKASFGNDAISESLERLVEDEAAKKIQLAYRKHYREQRAMAHSEGSATAFDHGTPLAARRLTLQRGDAMRNDSTPDEENSSTSNGSSENGKKLESGNAQGKSAATDLVSTSITKTSKTRTAATALDRAKIIMENKQRWLALRQNSMPVQIDSEVFRVIPKHMRKRIKSAEGGKKIRRRILKD